MFGMVFEYAIIETINKKSWVGIRIAQRKNHSNKQYAFNGTELEYARMMPIGGYWVERVDKAMS